MLIIKHRIIINFKTIIKQPILVTKNSEYSRKMRAIDKALGVRYRGVESVPGESFGEFKRRVLPRKSNR